MREKLDTLKQIAKSLHQKNHSKKKLKGYIGSNVHSAIERGISENRQKQLKIIEKLNGIQNYLGYFVGDLIKCYYDIANEAQDISPKQRK